MCIACATMGPEFWAAPTDGSSNAPPQVPESAGWAGTGSTGNAYIDGLISGHRWSGAITYSFPGAAGFYEGGITEATDSFRQVSFEQMQAARAVLEGYSPYSGGPRMGMTAFEQFTNASVSDVGFGTSDLRIAGSDSANPTAYAYYPSNDPRGGDVWFGTNYDYTNPRLGTYQYATMVHELGHALGLKHGHVAGGVANTAVPYDRDSMEFTVMTYRSYIGQAPNGYTNETFGYAQTFMMLDIAALQAMYGANFSTQSGNTVYSWSPTTGEAFINGIGQGAPGNGAGGSANRIFLTVWDGGGNDTYDFSNYTTDLRVDLSPGGWSTLSQAQLANLGNGNYARGNVFNALRYAGDPRSLIENAIGGIGHDVLVGNEANNWLVGGSGDDTLQGGFGSDRLEGGAGRDVAVFEGSRSGYGITLNANGTISVANLSGGADDGIDILVSIEELRFSDTHLLATDLTEPDTTPNLVLVGTTGGDLIRGAGGNDRLFGLNGADTIIGAGGADYMEGNGDDDALYGGAGDDYMMGFSGSDYFEGGRGIDRLYGGSGNDYLMGGSDADYIEGNDGDDCLYGESGNDYLMGGSGRDILTGGAGIDALYGEDGDDYLYGGDDGDILTGGQGVDALYGEDGNDYIYGGGDNDYIVGGNGVDALYGEDGDDYIYGGSGNDYISGGAGVDVLWGEGGDDYLLGGRGQADIFVHQSGMDGIDTILDFEPGPGGADVLRLIGTSFADGSAALAASYDSAGGVVLYTPASTAIIFAGISKGQLDPGDFLLL